MCTSLNLYQFFKHEFRARLGSDYRLKFERVQIQSPLSFYFGRVENPIGFAVKKKKIKCIYIRQNRRIKKFRTKALNPTSSSAPRCLQHARTTLSRQTQHTTEHRHIQSHSPTATRRRRCQFRSRAPALQLLAVPRAAVSSVQVYRCQFRFSCCRRWFAVVSRTR